MKDPETKIPENALTVTDNKTGKVTVIYVPNKVMEEFHEAEEPFCLTAGGRNSGKSHALRLDAHIRCLMHPNYRALLLRRSLPQLRNSHFSQMEVEGKLLGCPKPFNRSHYFLEYANGSKLQLTHCEDDAAVMNFLSQEWDWIGFDELTTFTFDQFIRIAASARTTATSGRKAYVRAATNPVGIGAGWVKRYFIDHSVTEEENPEYRAEEWKLVEANMDDNKHADIQNYERKLLMLPSESLRRAYRHGEWLVEGQFFSEWKERTNPPDPKEWHVVQEMPRMLYRGEMIPIVEVPWIQITMCLDWGYSEAEPGYAAWIAHLPDGTALVFKEWVFTQRIPEVAAQIIKDKSKGLNVRKRMGDPMMWQERTGKSIAHLMAKGGVSMYPADNDRENGWMALHSWLVSTYDNGQGERPRLQFLAPQVGDKTYGCPYAIRTLPSLQVDPKKPSDITEGQGVEDHAADALRYWASNWPSPSKEPPPHNNMPKELRKAIYGSSEGGEREVAGNLR